MLQVLQADGGTRCAAINAALLALADAGVPLRDMVAACAAGYLDGGCLDRCCEALVISLTGFRAMFRGLSRRLRCSRWHDFGHCSAAPASLKVD